ncbi:hypothetical protein A1O3_02433 [Capronia epimyces CBS 606.96]|uniref:WLM domain-containing protein n=1 Tax=Capronia epimyces CBS 606.96 TaxID=1182542 RepID=W9YJG6_9EURO|nr:uncharacterized protein A1O3_02433 [Capronia epimyces CBS 606.96]EXJ89366.1 hypothetical protein A1O3_02433 [Capronia epimyces CBS 606.96]
MPLNTLRLNHQKSSHPNDRIVFIKPLPRPPSDQASYDLADTFLRAIAAQCLPIMKKHYLSVTTLEEYEPNREFIGRNFNNGEIIQLVLQSKNGGWVPFNMVQMVMMHELAHNAHMNHGKAFWQTRNLYAEEVKALWAKGYTGEGFWGSGRTLDDMGAVMGNNILSSEELESLPLCGGTYRSRRRKRPRKGAPQAEMTWKEKRDRRIERKFGKNGVALGEDEDKRLSLEINRKGPVGNKPRVAQSKRGRELRAAAALARFETNKKEVNPSPQDDVDQGEDGEEQYEEVDLDADQEDARDVNGNKLLDSHGHGMIRVCDDEDTDNVNVQHELQELGTLDRFLRPAQQQQQQQQHPQREDGDSDDDGDDRPRTEPRASDPVPSTSKSAQTKPPMKISLHDTTARPTAGSDRTRDAKSLGRNSSARGCAQPTPEIGPASSSPSSMLQSPGETTITTTTTTTPVASASLPSTAAAMPTNTDVPATVSCPICSLENPRLNATCMACAHVLDPQKDLRHWSCRSETCTETRTAYLNPGDAGICGVCGARRETCWT